MRGRFRISRNDILLHFTNGPTFMRMVFSFVCLLTLVGSSFRPAPGLIYTIANIDAPSESARATTSDSESSESSLFYTVYQVGKGDTVSGIADSFDVSPDTIFSANNISSARTLKPGQLLKVPNQSGIVYEAKAGESVDAIAQKFSISADKMVEANGLLSRVFEAKSTIYLPDAHLPRAVLREISGDLFRWPVRGVITSWFSWRRDPFTGKNSFHNGLDIGVPMRTPVGAAMEGVVVETGYSASLGRYVIMKHSGGWKTLYGHMNSISVNAGDYIERGARLGYSGNTGYSTGPHVHFTVYKNGKLTNPANFLK
ncbi:MAG: M23 family metallopeptidase [Spirochaetes bacterium]|nr:M23 family metallopeptidase [Spirochaetota bacterium]